jgi:hypothetical protein
VARDEVEPPTPAFSEQQGERRIDMLEFKAVCDAIKLPLTEFAKRFEEACR